MSEQPTDHIYLQSVPSPVAAMAKSYPANYTGYLHSHERAQLLYAASGTMKVLSDKDCWIIPQQRAVWIPAAYPHQTDSIGPMKMRTLYIREDACPPAAPQEPRMLAVSGLLRELVLRTTKMPIEYDEQGHDGNLVTALLGETDWTPLHPVSLPPLRDTRLRSIEAALMKSPGDTRTLEEWAKHIGSSARTLSRLFRREARYLSRRGENKSAPSQRCPHRPRANHLQKLPMPWGTRRPGALRPCLSALRVSYPAATLMTPDNLLDNICVPGTHHAPLAATLGKHSHLKLNSI